MRSGIYLEDVLVRASADQRGRWRRSDAADPVPSGRTVALGQIASVEYGQEYPIVWRRNRRPTLTVAGRCRARRAPRHDRAGAGAEDRGAERRLPSGFHVEVGGTVEESEKAQSSVMAALPLIARADLHG